MDCGRGVEVALSLVQRATRAPALRTGPDNPFTSPSDSDRALQQDNGKYYYTYISAGSSSSAASAAAHDDASIHSTDRDNGTYPSKLHYMSSQSVASRSRPTSQSAASLASSGRPSMYSFSSNPLPRSASTNCFPPDQFHMFEVSQAPLSRTDRPSCDALLDTMHYVCSTCGEKPP
jgi:hypothetical protein